MDAYLAAEKEAQFNRRGSNVTAGVKASTKVRLSIDPIGPYPLGSMVSSAPCLNAPMATAARPHLHVTWLRMEGAAWVGGIVAVAVWAAAGVTGKVASQRELERFAALQSGGPADVASPDQRLWSPERIRAWQEARTQQGPSARAVLRIPRIRV